MLDRFPIFCKCTIHTSVCWDAKFSSKGQNVISTFIINHIGCYYYFLCVPARNRSKLGRICAFDISHGEMLLHT